MHTLVPALYDTRTLSVFIFMRSEQRRPSPEQATGIFRKEFEHHRALQERAVDHVLSDMHRQNSISWQNALLPTHVHGKKCVAGCMDDGLKAHLQAPPGIDITRGVSLSNSILNTAAQMIKIGANEIRSHRFCGAAGLAYKKLQENGQLPEGIYDSDTFARWYGDAVADQAGIEHEFVYHLDRPDDYHPARALVIPPKGMGVSAALPHGLSAFVLSRERFDPQNILLADNIARGQHGALHGSTDPFNVMLIVDRQPHGEDLARDLKSYVSGRNIYVHTITI